MYTTWEHKNEGRSEKDWLYSTCLPCKNKHSKQRFRSHTQNWKTKIHLFIVGPLVNIQIIYVIFSHLQ